MIYFVKQICFICVALSSNKEHNVSIKDTSKIFIGTKGESLKFTNESSILFTRVFKPTIPFIKILKTTSEKSSSTSQIYPSPTLKVKLNEKSFYGDLQSFEKDLSELPVWYYVPHLKFFKNTTRKSLCTCQSYLTITDKPVNSSSPCSNTSATQPIQYCMINIPVIITTNKPLCVFVRCHSNRPPMTAKHRDIETQTDFPSMLSIQPIYSGSLTSSKSSMS